MPYPSLRDPLLSGFSTYEDLLRHPMVGNLWEGYVLEDIINTLGDEYHFYFYRTAYGAECDLVIFKGNNCIAGEMDTIIEQMTSLLEEACYNFFLKHLEYPFQILFLYPLSVQNE